LDLIYVKHPELGNRHVPADQVAQLLASGWTRFPRSRAEKQRGAWPPAAAPAAPLPAGVQRTAAAIPATDYDDYDEDEPPEPPAPMPPAALVAAPAPVTAPTQPPAPQRPAKATQRPAKA
jgi:translation initiation factor IF-2